VCVCYTRARISRSAAPFRRASRGPSLSHGGN
jgi:hypothetical protein